MNVLEKILEEIGATEGIRFSRYTELLIAVKDVEKIIRSHMDEDKDTNVPSNEGWIPVEERLPNREECQKNNREFFVQDENGNRFSCEYDSESNGYDNPKWCCNTMIVAWQNFPQPYKPEEN